MGFKMGSPNNINKHGWNYDFWAGGPTKTGSTTGSNSVMDPLGLFSEGGIFGGPAQHPQDKAQALFLAHMMDREKNLFPVISELLGKSKENADLAYGAATGEANRLYPETMAGVSDYTLPPETLNALTGIYQDRLSNIGRSTDDMISSRFRELADRGITSADTAAGAGVSAEEGMRPAISKAVQDYSSDLLTLPPDLALKKYAIGTTYGARKAEALKNKYRDVLDPYLSMWKTSAGLGATPPADNGSTGSSEALGNIAELAGTAVGAYNDRQDRNRNRQKPAGIATT